MLSPAKLAGAVIWLLIVMLRWIKLQVHPIIDWWTESVLGVWEESTKSVIRESFTNTTRFVNGFFSWCLAFFVDREQYKSFRTSWTRTQAWQSWWQEDRQSTLNAFIATQSTTPSKQRKPEDLPKDPNHLRERQAPWLKERGRQLRFSLIRWKRALWETFRGEEEKKPRRPKSGSMQLIRNGSDLFDRPSGYAIEQSKRGLVEDIRISCEVGVTKLFDGIRSVVRRLFFLPPKKSTEGISRPRLIRHHTAPSPTEDESWEDTLTKPRAARFRRRKSFSSWEGSRNQTTAGDAIHAAGYPLQVHTVTTPDGYVMNMERIPRPGVRDVVFFMHGILDTSMGWVANGTGSHAFAAYDQGMDVWLGSSRSNPPRMHVDPRKQGSKYWHYTVNEMGMEDCLAQIDHIHFTKCQELNISAGPPPDGVARPKATIVDASPLATSKSMRRSNSESAMEELTRHLDVNSVALPPPPPRHSEERKRQASAPPMDLQHKGHVRSTPIHMPGPEAAGRRAQLRTSKSELRAQPNGVLPQRDQITANGNASLMNGVVLNSHQIDDVPEEDELVGEGLGEVEGSPSPRHSSDASSSRDREEEVAASVPSSPFTEAGSLDNPSTSMPARFHGFLDRPLPFQEEASASLSPDRSSHHGVENRKPSSTPSSRARDAMAERRAVEASRAQLAAPPDPYRLRVVAHSLGGAALLVYAVMRRKKGQPHHIYRLILLTPAGFLKHAPKLAWLFIWGLPVMMWLLNKWRPGDGAAVLIPSTWLRYITFKLTADLQSMPALQELTSAGIRLLLNGDASQWDRAMQMPHYNPTSMPAISLHTGMHLIQWVRSGRFRLFDYGSAAANMEHYNEPEPIDVAANYHLLDFPIDIMAGKADGIIARENVQQHYDCLKEAGCSVTYKEFDFGHLDFTFALKEELVYYVRSRLRLRH